MPSERAALLGIFAEGGGEEAPPTNPSTGDEVPDFAAVHTFPVERDSGGSQGIVKTSLAYLLANPLIHSVTSEDKPTGCEKGR